MLLQACDILYHSLGYSTWKDGAFGLSQENLNFLVQIYTMNLLFAQINQYFVPYTLKLDFFFSIGCH